MNRNKKYLIAGVSLFLCLLIVFLGASESGLIHSSVYDKYIDSDEDENKNESENEILFSEDGFVSNIDLRISPSDFSYMYNNAEKEEWVDAEVTINGKSLGKIGIKTRGNSSLDTAIYYGVCNFPFKLSFDRYRSGNTYAGVSSINLNPSQMLIDTAYEYIAAKVMEKSGVPTPRVGLALVTVNGVDIGMYSINESVGSSFIEKNYGSSDGSLYKSYNFDSPDRTDEIITLPFFQELKYIKGENKQTSAECLRSLTDSLSMGDFAQAQKLFDFDSFLDYASAAFCLSLRDSLVGSCNNFFLYDNGNHFSVIPWDFDLIDEEMLNINKLFGDSAPQFISLVLSNPDYLKKFKNGVMSLSDKLYEDNFFETTAKTTSNAVTKYMERCPFLFFEDEQIEELLKSGEYGKTLSDIAYNSATKALMTATERLEGKEYGSVLPEVESGLEKEEHRERLAETGRQIYKY